MMICRTISRVLPMVAVIAVGNVYSVDLLKKADANKATIFAVIVGGALPENEDAAKAALETAGVYADNYMSGAPANSFAMSINFAANLGVRKVSRCLYANKARLPKVDAGTAGNHVVQPLAEVAKAAAPQLIAGLVVMAVNASSSSSK